MRFRSYLTRMEQALPLFYLTRLYCAFPLLLSHHNGAGLLARFVSRDCSMRFRSYLTIMEQVLPLFLSHEIVLCVSALVISPELKRPSRSFYLTRLYSLCVSALVTSPKWRRPHSCYVTILEYKFLLLELQVCGNLSLCRLE